MTLSIAAYRQAGDLIEDIDIDDDAEIQVSKLGTRTLRISFPAPLLQRSGAAVATTFSGVYGAVLLPDANTGILYGSFALPAEWASGNITVRIWWTTAVIVNNAKFTIDVKSTVKDGTTASEETQSVTDTAKGVANQLNTATVTLAAADFAGGDVVGFSLTRNPADVADTLAADLKVHAITFEFTGRA